MSRSRYNSPSITDFGTVESVTEQQDKIGSVADDVTESIPTLDGKIQDDT
ncbi:hypothetical protein [Salinigranum halophilum]|nr:hypothetical protein [Salinigranum halophilum]